MTTPTLTAFFSDLLAVSWRAGWLIVVIAALRLVVRGRIPAQMWFAAWIVVALRLLLPFSVPATWSPYNLPGAAATPAAMPVPEALVEPVAFVVDASPPLVGPILATAEESLPVSKAPATPNLWGAVWFAGVAVMVGMRLAGLWGFRRRLRRARPLVVGRVPAMLAREGGAAARLVALETDAVDAPALYGLVRPRLLFPPALADRLSDAELRHVVRHELAHWRRRDLLAQGLMQAAVALHWFNPLAWLAARLARADCELACDEFVLRREAANGAGAYGATLLKVLGMVGRGRRPSPVVAMLEGREQLAHRIRMIAGYRAAGAGRAFAGVLLIAGIAVASVTRESRAVESARQPARVPAPPPSAVVSNAIPPVLTSPLDADNAAVALRTLQATVGEQQKRVESLAEELQAYKERNNMVSLDQRKDVVSDALKAANSELLRIQQALAASEIRIHQINEYRAKKADLSNLAFIASQPIVSQLLQQVGAKRIELRTLAQRFGPSHPEMERAASALAETERALSRAIENACQTIEAEHQAAQRNYQQAKQEFEKREKESIDLDRLALAYRNRERELRNQERILQNLAQRETEVAQAAASGTLYTVTPGDSFSISVMGAVNQQGAIAFTAADKPIVLDVIARAGGFAERANRSGVRVIRSDPDGKRTTTVLVEDELMSGTGPVALLRRGDIVVVPELPAPADNRRASVLGQVMNPGTYGLPTGRKLPLIELIAQAGGATRLGNMRMARITRLGTDGEKKVFTVDVDSFLKGSDMAAADFPIEPGDIVFIPERIL